MPLADAASGYLGAFALMVALWQREHDPEHRGQTIDLSLLESFFHMLGPWATAYGEDRFIMGRLGGRSGVSAPRNIYRAKDQRWVAVSAATDLIAQRCFTAIGRDDLNGNPRFATLTSRVEHIDEVDGVMKDWIGERDGAEVVATLGDAGVPASLIYNIQDIMADPHFQSREMVTDALAEDLGRTIKMQNVFPRLELTPGRIQWTGRTLGADNEAWFVGKLGLSSEEFEKLRADGVI